MSGVNKVILVGNLGSDPEIKTFQDGNRVAQLRVATSETWRDKNSGERKEKTEWHSVRIKNDGLVGVSEKYLKKGAKVYIEGILRTRKWQDQSGNDRYMTEVVVELYGGSLQVLANGRRDDNDTNHDHQRDERYGGPSRPRNPTPASADYGRDMDDEIPF